LVQKQKSNKNTPKEMPHIQRDKTMIEITKICQNCGKNFTIKGSRGHKRKYCSRKCNNKAYGERRTKRRRTDEKYREHLHELEHNRFIKNYHNKPGYKEHRIKLNMKQRKNNPITYEKYLKSARKSWRKRYYTIKEFRENLLDYQHDYYKENRNEVRRKQNEWLKTPEGRLADKRHHSKRRGLGHIPLLGDDYNPFPEEIPVDDHHVNKFFVIPLPIETHRKEPGANKQKHLQHNAQMIQKWFCFNINNLFSTQ
jgi:hypothetical protein